MIIVNNNIVIQSEYIRDLIRNPLDYESLQVDININCCNNNCSERVINTYTLDTTDSAWYIDLTTLLNLADLIGRFNIMSLISFTNTNAFTQTIDLSYIEDNCNLPVCSMEAYSEYFIPLFKDQIDAWFLTIGITTDITISFSGNTMKVEGFPVDFIPHSIEYGIGAPYTPLLFGYSEVDSPLYISSNSLFIQPKFFNITEFIDGVYNFTFKFTKFESSGYVIEQNCSFIDINTKCLVAAHLKNLKPSSDAENSSTSTNVHFMHYALTNSSNCGCNCEDMCSLYSELNKILTTTDPLTINDCGC